MNWTQWAIDATLSDDEHICYVPVEGDPDNNPTFVLGMNFIGAPEQPPGKVIMVIHADGDAAAQAWVDDHQEVLVRVRKASSEVEQR